MKQAWRDTSFVHFDAFVVNLCLHRSEAIMDLCFLSFIFRSFRVALSSLVNKFYLLHCIHCTDMNNS